MEAKEKAKHLINLYSKKIIDFDIFWGKSVRVIDIINESKQCALIAVDEILDKDGYNNHYWLEVKSEIEKL